MLASGVAGSAGAASLAACWELGGCPKGYVATASAGALLSGGRQVATLADVTIETTFNIGDSTQGSMRWVRLRWPGGSARVYSAATKDANRVALALIELGVGHRNV
jgi:hypothetical protein